MRRQDGLTAVETVLALCLAAVLFVIGLGLGGAFESEKKEPSAGASATAGSRATEPGAAGLAALSLATAARKEREATRRSIAAGHGAAETVLAESAKARARAAERAAYWASVGNTIRA